MNRPTSRFAVYPAIAVPFLVLSMHVAAAPPGSANCSGDVYERLVCRQAAVAGQLEFTSDAVFADGTKLNQRVNPARLANIHNAAGKAHWASSKSSDQTFRKLAKAAAQGNRKGGHLVPLTPADDVDDDGICDYEQGDDGAQCAAVELDEFGERQACNPQKKNKGKGGQGNSKFDGLECDVFYDADDAVSAEESADMVAAAEELEANYEAVERDLIEMNQHLEMANANLPDAADTLYAVRSNGGCVLPELTPGLSESVGVLRQVAATLEGVASMGSDGLAQTAVAFGFGGNASSLAVALDGAAAIANLAYITLDEIAGLEDAELQSAIMACVNQSASDIQAILALLTQMKAQMHEEHVGIMDNDNANTDEVVRLMHTPEGMRKSDRLACNGLPCEWPFKPDDWPEPPEKK